MDKRTFHSLDALRGVAALCVVMWHADWLVAPLRPQHGDLAVDLFFIISGFVIAHSYEKKLQGEMSAREFTILRLIRLYPLYALGSALGLAAALAGVGTVFDPASAALTTAMLPTPSLVRGASLYPYDAVAWSLMLEIAINVVFAFTWRGWTCRNILIALVASGLLIAIATLAHGDANFGWTWRNLPGGVARVCYGFPMGVLIHRLHRLGWLPRGLGFPFVLLATLVLLFWRPASWGLAFDLCGLLVVAPAVVALAVSVEPSARVLRLTAPLGAASYAIYALHLPLLETLRLLVAQETLGPRAPLPGLLFMAGVIVLGMKATIQFDAPLRRWLIARLSRARGALAPLSG